MPGKRLTAQQRENIWFLHLKHNMPKAEIARQTGISRKTVILVLQEEQPNITHLCDIVKKSVDKQNQQLIDIIENDNKIPEIVLKILEAINSKELIDEYAKNNGLKSLMTAFGVLSDKNINVKKLDLERRKVEALEKQVTLKERELDMRLTSPESFKGVTIINDVEDVREYKKLMEDEDVLYKN